MPGAVAAYVRMLCPTMSTRSMMGSSMPRGRSLRILEMASRASFSARSLLISSRSSMMVWLLPSVTKLVRCLTPVMLATASSTRLVVCASSSAGEAPGCRMVTETTGTSTLGARVTGSIRNDTRPSRVSTANSTSGGIGLRMAAPEILSAIA